MTPALLFAVLRRRARLRHRERWTRGRLEAHQATAIRAIRDHAYAKSAFYRTKHHGLFERPLHELPTVTKAELMASFDDAVTDPSLRLTDVKEHVASMEAGDRLADRWWIASTSGSTGLRGLFPWDDDEWTDVIASYARANEWAGLRVDPLHRLKMAVVSSRIPWHQSALVGASVASRMVPTLRLDATAPIAEIDAELDRFQPDSIVAYASMARLLAEEQLAGRLHVRPRAVMSASEVLGPGTRAKIRAAWNAESFDVYAATETAGIASECEHHGGLHLYEDLVVTEIVDEENRPVPPGVYGAKILVTVLFAHTLPLIRYEMSDCLALATSSCGCGRVFATVMPPRGRREDDLELPGADGATVRVHPNVVHRILEPLDVRAWQVIDEAGEVRALLAGAPASLDDAAIARDLRAALVGAGGLPKDVRVERVAEIPKGAMGKAPLVRNIRAISV